LFHESTPYRVRNSLALHGANQVGHARVASVFGAALAVFIAIHLGFVATLATAICCYLGAMVLMGRLAETATSSDTS